MPRHIVIIGGGIIGCTTAYYLTRHIEPASDTTITLIEASEHGPAQGASGKAGGLVARWAYPKEIVDLSFDEHVKLAEEHNGASRWGWRYVECGSWEGRGESITPSEGTIAAESQTKSLEKELGLPGGTKPVNRRGKTRTHNLPADLLWVKEELTDSYTPMARSGNTAQVHPYLFTTSMFELATERGLQSIQGRVTSIQQSDGRVTGVQFVRTSRGSQEPEPEVISATDVVLAAGAWSPRILSQLPITGTRAHSITIQPHESISIAPYVLFTEIRTPSGSSLGHGSPEIYARPDNEVYACGPGDNSPLPVTVDDVEVSAAACDLVYDHVASISKELREGVVTKRQACFLPTVTSGGGPIIGEATSIAKGLFIGTGHTCWGISNGPGTGKALAELILDGKIRSANLRKLSPAVLL